MPHRTDQILTVAQMRAAEAGLIAAGSSVATLMEQAGRGAAEWVWRLAAGRSVTVLCGPGNNGGDGYVIAETLRARGLAVRLVAPQTPRTPAAIAARARYGGEIDAGEHDFAGAVLVDCLFGTGLARPLEIAHQALLWRLVRSHHQRIAIDLPSGTDSDSGQMLIADLPDYDLTVALGAWKFAHWLMPACAKMGALQLVELGVAPVAQAAQRIARPRLSAPAPDAHKYRRGLLAVVGGAMPGAALLSCAAAQRAGAGYVKLLADAGQPAPPELVVDAAPLRDALADPRIAAVLVGPGLGRDARARDRLAAVLASRHATVLDADALMLLEPVDLDRNDALRIATPHEGELERLEQAFGLDSGVSRPQRASALAQASGMVIVAKGADTLVASPNGRIACLPRASSWLSTAGTGDVLAGIIASRLATGTGPFVAACQGVWLHAEAALLCPVPFTPAELACAVPAAYAACL